jgi:hypothetical protein
MQHTTAGANRRSFLVTAQQAHATGYFARFSLPYLT